MMRRASPLRRFGLLLAALACLSAPAAAGERRIVPALTIYPGDIIRDQMLTEADFPNVAVTGAFVSNRAIILGKAAKRTLLPGQPIPSNAFGEPKLVTIGAMVRLVYEEDGMTISTYASAMQAGAAGDLVSVRNTESGIVVSGVIQPDGSIHVGPAG